MPKLLTDIVINYHFRPALMAKKIFFLPQNINLIITIIR